MTEGLVYVRDFLDERKKGELQVQLDRLSFYQDTFRGRKLRRKYAQFGFRYGSTGRSLERAAPFPESLLRLAERARALCAASESINQCIIAYYDVGDGIGWHTDAHAFGECIIGVSLGGPARFQFRRNGESAPEYELLLDSGSLYCMSGLARWNYQHRILPVRGSRFGLTFRHVRGG